jgi:hypothetical protein
MVESIPWNQFFGSLQIQAQEAGVTASTCYKTGQKRKKKINERPNNENTVVLLVNTIHCNKTEVFRHPDQMAPESTVRGMENIFPVRPR